MVLENRLINELRRARNGPFGGSVEEEPRVLIETGCEAPIKC